MEEEGVNQKSQFLLDPKSLNPRAAMSGKHVKPLEDSSSEEDEVETTNGEGEDTDESGNSSTEEDDDESAKTPTLKNPEASLTATKEKSDSDTESGSEEETDSDSEPERNNQLATKPGSSIVKPVIGTKDSVVKKNQESKKVESCVKSVAKRSSSEIDGVEASTDAKRVKRVSGEEEKKSSGGEETKKTYFQRVWSEDDEIVVLKGLTDHKTITGVNPYDDTNGFYQLVKKSISFDVSKIQFMEKLRSLKKKYETNVGKAKNGKEQTFVKAHDLKAFELSKLIWGPNGLALESAVKSNVKSKKSSSKSKKVESVKQDLASSLRIDEVMANEGEVSWLSTAQTVAKSVLFKSLVRSGVDDLAAQEGWSKLAVEDKKRFEEEWKAMQLREFEFYSQKSGFLRGVVTKMAEAIRSNP